MPLLYCVISRGTTVLARFANFAGNFSEVTEQVLAQIGHDNSKMTYSHGSYLFHYISEERIIYLCISDDEFDRSRAFLFLNDIKKRFQIAYGSHAHSALPYAMNTDFSKILAAQMKHYSEARDVDTIACVQGELDELKNVMVQNIDTLASRGERLELLVNKTENLSASAVTFRKSSRNLARSLFWKNMKITILTIVVILVVIYFIVSMACGGLSWSSCIQN